MVLPNGTVIDANRKNHPDLVRALRGGSNNFGIVTRFDLATFQQGQLWGGDINYDETVTSQVLNAFVDFGGQEDYDEYAALYISNCYVSDLGQFFTLATPIYTTAVENPRVFQPFTRIQSQLSNTLHTGSLSTYTNSTPTAAALGKR